MIYWQAPYLAIHWNAAGESVQMEWKQGVQGDEFRDALDRGLKLLKVKGSSKWLADLRDLGALLPEDEKWAREDWFPRALAAGLKYMAIVDPLRSRVKLSVDRIMSRVPHPSLQTRYFDEPDEAANWLARQAPRTITV